MVAVSDIADYRQPESFAWVPRKGDALTEAGDIIAKAKFLYESLEDERSRLFQIDKWYRGAQDAYQIQNADVEMQRMLELGRTPWLGLVVSTIAQALFVDGFRDSDSGKPNEQMWDWWVRNGMQAHQMPIHRAALGYGYSFALAEASKDFPRIRGLSAKRCYAVYRDPAVDLWPEYAIRVNRLSESDAIIWLYDSVLRHEMVMESGKWKLTESVPHGASHVPIVRYKNQIDLDGNTPGEVEPFIGIAARIDKTMFDRLLVQHYNSWKKIYIAGLKRPAGMSDDEMKLEKMRLRQQDLLMLEDVDTKVGTLAETGLEGFIKAIESDVEQIAILSQLNHLLTGRLANLSADTLVTANRPLTQKVFERKVSFGESHNQLMRLVAELAGDDELASSFGVHATWQDTDSRSLAQAADGLGKLAESLGIPKPALWRMVPDVTEQQALEWEKMLLSDDPVQQFLDKKEREMNAPQTPLDAVDQDSDEPDDDGGASVGAKK